MEGLAKLCKDQVRIIRSLLIGSVEHFPQAGLLFC